MRKTCAAAALVAAVLGGGCSADEGDDSGGTSVPSPPQVGECHDTPREVNSFGVALVDAEPAVDCSESHTLETTKVIDVAPGFTAYDAQGFMPECDKAVWRYVDAKPFVSTVVGWIHVPSEEQRAAGQSWVRVTRASSATPTATRDSAPAPFATRSALIRAAVRDLRTDSTMAPRGEPPARLVPTSPPVGVPSEFDQRR